MAATAPSLGTAQSYSVLGASTVTSTIVNNGPTIVAGDLGLYPGSDVTGFPPGIVYGDIHIADAQAIQAQNDVTAAYTNLGQTCGPTISADLGGQTLVPGVYCSDSSMGLTGTLTLDAQGDTSAVWVFRMGSSLTTGSASSVVLINGGQDCNVFWQVGSFATLGTTTNFVGNILALTSITLNTGANLKGRALARNGAVTLDSYGIAASSCSASTSAGGPTLGKSFSPATINPGGVSTLTITLSNPNPSVVTLTAPLVDNLPTGLVIASTPNAVTTCSGAGEVSATAGGSTVTLPATRSIPASSTCTMKVDGTAVTANIYPNILPANALQTDKGNNINPAITTLTVGTPGTIPEFPTVALPVIAVIGLIFLFQRRKGE